MVVVLFLIGSIGLTAQTTAVPGAVESTPSTPSVPTDFIWGSPLPVTPTVVVPDGAKDTLLFYSSIASHGLATYSSIVTSWKQLEPNPLYADQTGAYTGKFYMRGTITKSVIAGMSIGAQIYLVRKYPQLKRYFAYVNFGVSTAYMGQTVSNIANH